MSKSGVCSPSLLMVTVLLACSVVVLPSPVQGGSPGRPGSGAAASRARRLLLQQQPQAQQPGSGALPQFLLPQLPPQATGQVVAVLAGLGGTDFAAAAYPLAGGNVNTFLAAVDAAHRMGGSTALGVAFSAAMGARRSAQLAAAIGSSVALVGAGSQLAQALGEGYALAVTNLVGRNDTQAAAEAAADAFLLAGGAGLALATSTGLEALVESVGCSQPIVEFLKGMGEVALRRQQMTGNSQLGTLALSLAQHPGLSACWLAADGQVAFAALQGIAPVVTIANSSGAGKATAEEHRASRGQGSADPPAGQGQQGLSILNPASDPWPLTTLPIAAAEQQGLTAGVGMGSDAKVTGLQGPPQPDDTGAPLLPPHQEPPSAASRPMGVLQPQPLVPMHLRPSSTSSLPQSVQLQQQQGSAPLAEASSLILAQQPLVPIHLLTTPSPSLSQPLQQQHVSAQTTVDGGSSRVLQPQPLVPCVDASPWLRQPALPPPQPRPPQPQQQPAPEANAQPQAPSRAVEKQEAGEAGASWHVLLPPAIEAALAALGQARPLEQAMLQPPKLSQLRPPNRHDPSVQHHGEPSTGGGWGWRRFKHPRAGSPSSSMAAAPVPEQACSDVPPDSQFTCREQAGWGKCQEGWMLSGNFCAATCGRCPAGQG